MLEATAPFCALAANALATFEDPRRSPRVFIIDDDPAFCRHLQRVGAKRGVQVSCYHPDKDFLSLPLDGEFDVAIVDYDLGELTGTQLSGLYHETPIVLISGRPRADGSEAPWPSSVKGFVHKLQGAERIIQKAMSLSSEGGRL